MDKQVSQANPTIEEIKQWDEDELLECIQQNRPKLLKDYDLKKFKEVRILGKAFLMLAGNVEFFENKCNLPIGTNERLADLARETAGIKSKLCTPRRQQADNVTGKRRQDGDTVRHCL